MGPAWKQDFSITAVTSAAVNGLGVDLGLSGTLAPAPLTSQ